MARDLHKYARQAWERIKYNLDDRRMWEGDFDKELEKEIDDEQIDVIFKAMLPLDMSDAE